MTHHPCSLFDFGVNVGLTLCTIFAISSRPNYDVGERYCHRCRKAFSPSVYKTGEGSRQLCICCNSILRHNKKNKIAMVRRVVR